MSASDSSSEEGELVGEVYEPQAEQETPIAAPEPPPPPPEKRTPPKEQLLAPRDERAPYFADPFEGMDGWSGRRLGGKKKRKKGAGGFVDVYGEGAAAAVEVYPEQGPIRLADAQNLVLWVLGEGTNPRWCFVKNKPLVKRVVLLVAHGLDSALWESGEGRAGLPTWRRCLGEPIELQARNATLAPGATVHTLLTVPQTRKRRREEEGAQAPPPPPPPPQQEQQGAAGAPAAAAAAVNGAAAANGGGEVDLHELAHGAAAAVLEAAAAAAAAAPAGAAEASAATADTPGPSGPAAAKRMRLAAADDVSSRVAPLLAGAAPLVAEAAAAAQEAAAQAAAAVPAAVPAEQAAPDAAAAPGGGAAGGAAGARRPPCALPPSHYVLTLEQLAEHGYPLPRLDEASGEMVCPEGFVATQACKGAPLHDLVALDCEMCITQAGFELTRATLVDRQGKVLLDELCVPHNPITDHNTRYSGITAEMLEGVTTRLEDVQARLKALVAAETLLVAHSGENDLQALKLIHANVIDTSVLYPHPRGPPFKSALRVLASRHLLRTIQQGEHNPVEDARAAMDLALLKFERGPTYAAGGGERGDKLLAVLGDAGRRSTMVDRLEVLNRHVVGNCSAVPAEGDAAAVAQLCKEVQKAQVEFVWGQLTSLQQFYEARLAAAKASGEPEPTPVYQALVARGDEQQVQQQEQQQPPPPSQAQQQEGDGDAAGSGALQLRPQDVQQQQGAALQSLDRSLAQLWDAAPTGTLVVVVTGQGDTTYSRYLQEQKWRRQQGLDGMPPWGPECEAHLAAVNDRVMSALCFAAVKPPIGGIA